MRRPVGPHPLARPEVVRSNPGCTSLFLGQQPLTRNRLVHVVDNPARNRKEEAAEGGHWAARWRSSAPAFGASASPP